MATPATFGAIFLLHPAWPRISLSRPGPASRPPCTNDTFLHIPCRASRGNISSSSTQDHGWEYDTIRYTPFLEDVLSARSRFTLPPRMRILATTYLRKMLALLHDMLRCHKARSSSPATQPLVGSPIHFAQNLHDHHLVISSFD